MGRMDRNISTSGGIGHELIGELIFHGGPGQCAVLNTLLYVLRVPKAEVARATGLSRGRVNHYEYGQPVPQHQQLQLYAWLRSLTEEFEENLTALDERPEEFEAGLVPEAVPVARAMVKACRKVLADFEAGINGDKEAA